jgi:hypothetical protein
METTDKYVLIGQSPVPCDDLLIWAKTYEQQDRRVAEWIRGPIRVSTVFLGIDHNIARLIGHPELPPHLFETMTFFLGSSVDEDRCATWLEAESMHQEAVSYVRTMWRRPRVLAEWIQNGLECWMWMWDQRFASRSKGRNVLLLGMQD